ncbi:cell envelope integrity protein TolA [Hoeflea sp. Naph1]|uniref:cell envelope integrity protein TolA n=1 Tax=Hoeflea sp. Naph1 TaxID=3388653 RepID=UPI00398FB1A0
MMIVGTAFEDALAAGEAADEADEHSLMPVDDSLAQLEPVETASLDPSDTAELEAVVAAPLEPVKLENHKNAPTPIVQALEIESVIADLTPLGELAAVADIPVPLPRPEMTAAEQARSEAPAEKKPPHARVSKPSVKAQPTQKTAATKPKTAKSSGGRGGKQATSSSKGASKGVVTAKHQTRAGNAAVSNYPGKVASKLRRALRYPKAARKDRLKGQAVVSFTVAANGSVSSIRIVRSSGSLILDNAALEAVHRAAPFSPIPSGAGRNSWRFSVPLAFKR